MGPNRRAQECEGAAALAAAVIAFGFAAVRSVEGISHQTVAHGVQADQPCLTYPFAADRESSFMKAGYGKTVRPVCAADGGKLFIGRLLRPDRWRRATEGPNGGSGQQSGDLARAMRQNNQVELKLGRAVDWECLKSAS